jgi:hypothetical protein
VQISETETPLHRLETVYRRMMEHLSVPGIDLGAFRQVIDGWFFALEEELIAAHSAEGLSQAQLLSKTSELMEKRLGEVARVRPQFASVLRAYRKAPFGQHPGLAGLAPLTRQIIFPRLRIPPATRPRRAAWHGIATTALIRVDEGPCTGLI